MKTNEKIKLIISIFLIILNVVSLSLLSYSIILYNGIETFYRIFGILILVYFLVLLGYLKIKNNNNIIKYIIYSIITLIFIVTEVIGFYYLNKIYKTIDSYSTVENIYSTSLVTYDPEIKSYNDLNGKKIGIVDDNEDIEGNILANDIIKKLNLDNTTTIIKYPSTMNLLYALKNKEIDAAFFSSNYIDMFSSLEDFENIAEETNVIYTEEKQYEMEKTEEETTTSSLTKPFSILIIGVDSSKDGVTAGYNADVLLLLTFNPETLNATFTSIPRDMYIQTACSNGAYRRINTTTWGSSSSCAVNTIENLFDIKIDYYAKINFKGVVQLVDALGGITVNVPYSFCEQNSSRKWGDKTIYVEKGLQKLNGEQALAFARNRHKPNDGSTAGKQMAKYCPTYDSGSRNDYTRGKNQIKIIQALLSNATKLKDPNQAIDILEQIKTNFQTNVKTNDILSLYDLGKSLVISDATNLINIKRLQLTGKNVWGMVYDESTKNYPAVTIPYQESINAIKKEIKINLGKTTQKEIKEMSFDLNNQYEAEIIGKGNYSTINITTLKDLSTYSLSQIKEYANKVNKKLIILDYDTNQELNIDSFGEYYFYKQKEHKDIILNQIKSITIYVKKSNVIIEKPEEVIPETPNETNPETQPETPNISSPSE